jgi:hypothetical protein
VNEWIVELSLRCGDLGGECKEGDLSSYGRTSITRPDRGVPAVLVAVGPSRTTPYKRGTPGAQEPMFIVPTQCPTNPRRQTDHRGR